VQPQPGSLALLLSVALHADKNPVLSELATEVTKLINEALTKHEIS